MQRVSPTVRDTHVVTVRIWGGRPWVTLRRVYPDQKSVLSTLVAVSSECRMRAAERLRS